MKIIANLYNKNESNIWKDLFTSLMQKLLNLHLTIGGCITKGKIAVILMVITKGSWKGMVMAGKKPKNITQKYLKESLGKLSSYGMKQVRIMRIPDTIAEEYKEPEEDDEWSSYGQKRDAQQTE